MHPPPPSPGRQRRSRLWLTVFLLAIVALSILGALLIRGGLQDEPLQEQLRELREEGR